MTHYKFLSIFGENLEPNVKNIGDVTTEISRRNTNSDVDLVLSVSNKLGIVPQKRIYTGRIVAGNNKSNYKIIYETEFAYNPAAINSGSVGILKNIKQGIVSPMYVTFKASKKHLLPEYLNLFLISKLFNIEIRKRLEGSVRITLKYNNFSKIKINTYNINLQKQISTFFSKIFSKIETETSIKNNWELFLKSISEKTFQLGKDVKKYYIFNDKIKVFFDNYSGIQGIEATYFAEKGNKYIPFKNVYYKKILSTRDSLNFKLTNKKQNLVYQNDILITGSSETQNDIGKCSLYTSEEKVYLCNHCFGIRLKEKYNSLISTEYVNVALDFPEYRREIFKLSQGSTRYSLSKEKYVKLTIRIPNYDVQIKIAKVLYGAFRITEIQALIIEKTELLKKYFLNSLFPTS